jgi:hypothetical protein
MKRAFLFVITTAALAGCGEKTQTIGQGARSDVAAFEGTGMPFTAPGWKPGDRTSWEAQLRTRAQNGQNEYSKVN